MTPAWRDRLTGIVLLAVAIVWSVLVYRTVPAGDPDPGSIGPRAFPLQLGLVLAGLSVLLILRSLRPSADDVAEETEGSPAPQRTVALIAAGVFGVIVLYAFFIERLGFRLASLAIIPCMMAGLLRIRQPVLIAAYAVGISLGCWLIFHKILGAYLPVGRWTWLS